MTPTQKNQIALCCETFLTITTSLFHNLTNSQFYFTSFRVFPSIFDQTFTAHFLKTGDARMNRFFSLKHLTPKLHDDSISDVIAPSGGSSELINFKHYLILLHFKCNIYSILVRLPTFDCKLNWLSQMGFQL